MVRVRVLASLAGEPFAAGDTLDLPDDKARQLIVEERAELIEPPKRPKP